MEKLEFIINEFSKAGLDIGTEKADKFLKYYQFLIEYNEKVNLTAITDFEDVVIKHFVDSVLPFTLTDISEYTSFIDVGTGAGFPSIPLMIYNSNLKGTLLEALNKRCVFLKQACDMLGLNAIIVHGRAEEYAKEKREAFDFATARAVAAMPVLCEYCIPYVRTGGKFIALKSVNESAADAANAVKVLGGEKADTIDYTITNGDSRRLFIIEKVSHTPTKYPRNAGMIKKKPL